ncbi:MAG: thiamine ABC transporter substrate binding subunit [Candidatus Malihini olakiniferum]
MLQSLLSRLLLPVFGLYTMMFSSAAAIAKPALIVYTYDSFASEWGPGPAIKKAFEKKCECELNFVALEDSVTLLNRLRMEGKKSKADIVLGLNNNLLKAASDIGLFTAHNVKTSTLTLPGGWNNAIFLPYDYGYFAFIYNKDTLKNPPTSLDALINSNQPLKVIYQDPRTSIPGLSLLLWMQKVYSDKAPDAWQKLARKTVTVTKGWSEAYGLFLKGEADMVLSYTTSPAYHIIEEKKNNYAAALFSEGHYMQVEVAGQLAASKQPELANCFMQFILSAEFQSLIPTTNWMYPVTGVELPVGFQSLARPEKALIFSAQDVADLRGQWIQAWQRTVSR